MPAVRFNTALSSYIMVAVSFFWLLALPHQDYSKRTYVSENALLPGSVIFPSSQPHNSYRTHNLFNTPTQPPSCNSHACLTT